MKDTTPRKTAKALGLKKYEGRACINGHGTVRSVANGDCITCRNIAKAKAAKKKRRARGLLKVGRKIKYSEFVGPPKPTRKHSPKPITEFDFWVKRSRTGNPARTKLPLEYYQSLFTTHCPLLGIELTYVNCGKKAAPSNYATLDRIDSSKGYVMGNVQILSFRANTIKGSTTIQELELILNNWKKADTIRA